MARVFDIHADEVRKLARRLFQSGNVNFIFGAGASVPAIPVVGAIEKELEHLYATATKSEADLKLYEFLALIQSPMNTLIDDSNDAAVQAVLEHYRACLAGIELILSERRTDLLPKSANIFTTNYDLFLEKASESFVTFKLNDGFVRLPSLKATSRYSSQSFFDSVYARGPQRSYKVEVPSINLIKLHGSLSWRRDDERILYAVSSKPLLTPASLKKATDVASFVDSYAVVLPHRSKFQVTLMEQIHYDLLRIFANELDKHHTILVAFGFSFEDNHILHVVQRALSNPTLIVLIFAHSADDVARFQSKFPSNNNVLIIQPKSGSVIDFKVFNDSLSQLLPRSDGPE